MRAIVRTACLLLGAAHLLPTSGLAQDWPQWRGPNRDGIVHGAKAPDKWPRVLTEEWRVPVGEGAASPVVAIAFGDDLNGVAVVQGATPGLFWTMDGGATAWTNSRPHLKLNAGNLLRAALQLDSDRAGADTEYISARQTGHERDPTFAALARSHHHTVGNPEKPYFGSGSGCPKRSQRTLRTLPSLGGIQRTMLMAMPSRVGSSCLRACCNTNRMMVQARRLSTVFALAARTSSTKL